MIGGSQIRTKVITQQSVRTETTLQTTLEDLFCRERKGSIQATDA